MAVKYLPVDGQRVRVARKQNRITQIALAKAIEISQSNLSFIEAGRHNTAEDIVGRMAKVLKVTAEWLTGESDEGGFPLHDVGNSNRTYIDPSEVEKISHRFIIAYERLKTLGVIESDAQFCKEAKVNPSNFSLALAGKSPISLEWIPQLEEKGVNREYIYNDRMPIIKLNPRKQVKNAEDLSKNIQMLIENIESDMKQLKFYLKQVL